MAHFTGYLLTAPNLHLAVVTIIVRPIKALLRAQVSALPKVPDGEDATIAGNGRVILTFLASTQWLIARWGGIIVGYAESAGLGTTGSPLHASCRAAILKKVGEQLCC